MRRSRRDTQRKAVPLFIGTLLLGALSWFYVFVQGRSASSTAETDQLVLILWCGGGFAVSGVAAALQRRAPLIWSIGFAAPMFAWGLVNTLIMLMSSQLVFWWAAYGFATVVAAFVGALSGKTLSRRFKSRSKSRD
ncbi:MAG: hypothetical protein H0X66_19920 [Verrucomicrobia bacterium]|nr:hypothetical protein [Verrucomicrobiota bacterium]